MKREGEKTTAGLGATDVLSQGLAEQANVQAKSVNEDIAEVAAEYGNLKTGACATNVGLCAEHPATTTEKLEQKAKKATDTYVETMRRWSSAVRNYRVEDLTHQVQDFARHHPALLLGGALLAGFALTRAIKITGNGSRQAERGGEPFYSPTSGRDILPAEEEVFHS